MSPHPTGPGLALSMALATCVTLTQAQTHNHSSPVVTPSTTAPASESWTRANESVGQFPRGHIDLLRWEQSNVPSVSPDNPAVHAAAPLSLAQALHMAMHNQPRWLGRTGMSAAELARLNTEGQARVLQVRRAWIEAVAARQSAHYSQQILQAAEAGTELAERMARERDNFGFYFSAHPVEQFRAIASANGARSFASLMVSGGPSGGRAPAVMAAMVEKVNRGRTRKGKDFVRADFSDSTGQFSAACFEESLVANFVKWADEGTCVLLNVELDSPSPDEPPRVTVRGARPLRDVKAAARMMLSLEAHLPEAIEALRAELVPGPDGQGEVRVTLRTGGEGEPIVRIGRSYQLDGELAERLASIEGLANVQLTTQRGPNLRLVA